LLFEYWSFFGAWDLALGASGAWAAGSAPALPRFSSAKSISDL
jgi:hypothetical protein